VGRGFKSFRPDHLNQAFAGFHENHNFSKVTNKSPAELESPYSQILA